MRLNAQTDYSLRILMYLATKQGEIATIQEVSTRLKLSQSHLMRIAAKLASTGLVETTRGRSGGLVLGKDATRITVEEVLRAIEPDFALVECFKPSEGGCTVEPACRLKGVLGKALKAFFDELRDVTLADLTQPNRARLADIFWLSPRTGDQPMGGLH
ncbi:MAG: Rrf2 family transcriptional regulator [Fimbriimonadaceae bacterium]|nr:Rrf2 family transcriptional regulator [Chthonomonadaceae bacterium]MCO5295781.1 Rrf2 family transcriptional regulator [Fimbriimonadaceae bacterium]